MVDTPECCEALQKDLNRLKKWPEKSCLKFKKGNAESCGLAPGEECAAKMVGANQPENRTVEKDPEGLGTTSCP